MSFCKFVSLFLVGATVIGLNGCAAVKDSADGMATGFGNFGHDVAGLFKSEPKKDDSKVDIVSYYDPRYYGSNYDQVATEMSNSDITVYGYGDGPVAGDMPAPGTPPEAKPYKAPKANVQDVRGVTASDPNVTVYPFDDGAYQPQEPVGITYNGAPRSMAQNNTNGAWKGKPVPMPTMSPKRAPTPMPVPVDGANGPRYNNHRPTLQPVQQGDAIAPNRIYFAHDSETITPNGKAVIDHVARDYKDTGGDISVEGHASSRAEQPTTVERKITNLKVSMERALHVSNALMKDGVPAAAIETKAYGDTRPPLVGVGMDPEAAARRVEIYSK